MEDSYESVLKSRYCRNSPLLRILSERNKTLKWRQLWIWLAEVELELGLKQITREQIDEMKSNINNIDFEQIRIAERRLKHDVMAHVHVFGQVCPTAAGIIHLGATSCDIQDNADLIIQRECIDYLIGRLAVCIDRALHFAETNIDVVTVGRTHLQAASLVTVGKRMCMWSQELLMALNQLTTFRQQMAFRGMKGATGTQDSFMTLFNGDEQKVDRLDTMIMIKAQFEHKFDITGQTYSRQQDVYMVNALALIGAAADKICGDIRNLQAVGELLEPFEAAQIGSSAMPYKRNPMKSERCCGIANVLMSNTQTVYRTFASQRFERTLDDSVARRIILPDSILKTDALLSTLQNIFEGLSVQKNNIARIVADELPFLAMEKALMYLSEAHVDRQLAHEKIRQSAIAAKEKQQHTGHVTIEEMISDSFFDGIRERLLKECSNPINFTGRCVSQTRSFIATARTTIAPLMPIGDEATASMHIDV